MDKILVNIPATEEHKRMLEEAAAGIPIEYTKPKLVNEEVTRDATIIIGNVSHKYVQAAENLKWVQLNSAGNYGFTKRVSLVIGEPIHLADHCKEGLSEKEQLEHLTKLLEEKVFALKEELN